MKIECQEKFLNNITTKYCEIGMKTLITISEKIQLKELLMALMASPVLVPLWIVGFVAEKSGLVDVSVKSDD